MQENWRDLAAKGHVHGTPSDSFSNEASSSWGTETRIAAMPKFPSEAKLMCPNDKCSGSAELVTIPHAI
jgi:hypothetical protein